MIITGSRELKSLYHELGTGDVFAGTITCANLKHQVMIDLLERGVVCVPSFLSQILTGSKAAQALMLSRWMIPHTRVIRRRHDLIKTINLYNKLKTGRVISKEDRMNCGHGIRKWPDVEMLYSCLALDKNVYPFVVQPFLQNFIDVRVIIAGDYVEAYTRYNPLNFRNNISAGGENRTFGLNKEQEEFCFQIMERAKFPFAHIDLLITENGHNYLSEIALNGGIKGAKISREELEAKKRNIIDGFVKSSTSALCCIS